MIERLAALELSGFRCFSTPDNVPLDADIVLIHGSNGTGKTSLLSAIELALTGKVHELSVFESDYPRCLRNVTQNSDGYVRLKYLSEHDEEIVVKHDFGETTRGSNAELSSADINFFRD